MRKLRKIVNQIIVDISWITAKIIVKSRKNLQDSNAILIVPAADLDGGFGEDLMVISLLKNFFQDRPVSLLNFNQIIRKDYQLVHKNLTFLSGFTQRVNYVNILNIINRHSLVIVIGADIMDGTYDNSTSINRLRILELANYSGTEAQITGFSVSKSISQRVKDKFIHVSSFMKIKLRDIESYKRVAEFISEDRLVLTNDIAFICPDIPELYRSKIFSSYEVWANKMRTLGKTIIGVCPNSIQAKKFGLDNYERDFSLLLNSFADSGSFAFVFLYHDLRLICENDNDSTISSRFYERYKVKTDSFYTDQISNGVALKGYLSLIDFTITGRMHLGISGATYGKPMFGVAYANKFEGMVKLFSIDPDKCLIEFTDIPNQLSVVSSFIANFPSFKSKVEASLPEIRRNTLLNITKN